MALLQNEYCLIGRACGRGRMAPEQFSGVIMPPKQSHGTKQRAGMDKGVLHIRVIKSLRVCGATQKERAREGPFPGSYAILLF
jgi:hypothetical protein